MAKMKNSGIEWIGEIPEDWEVTKLKYGINDIKVGPFGSALKGNDFTDEGFWVYNQRTVLDNNFEENDTFISEKKYQELSSFIVKPNDILITTRGSLGKMAIVPENAPKGILHPCIIKFRNSRIIGKYFLKYIFNNSPIIESQINYLNNSTTIGALYSYTLKEFYIPLPSPETQKHIAKFLDAKCVKIDGLKSDIQKQIETLEQYKKSVITEAVTKGINPNAKMKDSGVEWIGNIPEYWEVSNPKWHFTQRKDRARLGLKQYTASQKYGVISQEEYMERTGTKIVTVAKDFDILKLVCPGDFVIHMRSFQGGLEYSEAYGSISSAYVMLIPQKTIANPRYYRWFFKSPVYIDALSSTSNLIRDGQAMRYANFVQIPILIPTADEQTDIADYLDKKCSSIDNIISTKKQQLEKLEEYKKSLIFEYVTGKKKC